MKMINHLLQCVIITLFFTYSLVGSTIIRDEIKHVVAPETSDVPWLVKTSASLIDGVRGPLIPLTQGNAPHLTTFIQAICARLKLPVPGMYLNTDMQWCGDMSQGSLTPDMAYIVIGKAFVMHPAVDDQEIMNSFLHECGHNAHYHNLKLGSATLGFTILYLYWLSSGRQSRATKAVASPVILAAAWAAFLAYARRNELKADAFEAHHCQNPQEMLTQINAELQLIDRDRPTITHGFAHGVALLDYYFTRTHPALKKRLDTLKLQLEQRLSQRTAPITD